MPVIDRRDEEVLRKIKRLEWAMNLDHNDILNKRTGKCDTEYLKVLVNDAHDMIYGELFLKDKWHSAARIDRQYSAARIDRQYYWLRELLIEEGLPSRR